MKDTKQITWDITGEFGGGSPPAQHVPVEYPDTGRSTQAARLLIVLSEGEIEGVQNVFLKQVPYKDYNVTVESRNGTADQLVVNGFAEVYAPLPSNSAIITTSSPAEVGVPRLFDAVNLTQTLSGLYAQQPNGDVIGTSIQLDYYTRIGVAAPWIFDSSKSINAKYSSTYAFSKTVNKPAGVTEADWYVKIVRVTGNSSSSKLVNATTFSQGIGVKWSYLAYPHKALLGLTLKDASQFGGSIPEILAKVKGIKVRLPNNYNPVTRVYTGVWEGTFALLNQYTSNPAWCLFHCLTNSRMGLGITDDEIDLFAFYELGKFCDELLTNGKGGLEPRYAINCQFIVRENLATFFMYFLTLMNANWSTNEFGQISLMWDRAGQPVTKQVTNANIVDGIFNYSSTDLEQRCNFVSVTYSDPDAFGRTNTALEFNDCLIGRYGLQQLDLVLVGCTSKAQAIRKARWALYNSGFLYNIIEFSVMFEGLIYYVGEIISVCDNFNQTDMTAGVFTSINTVGLSVTGVFDRAITVSVVPYYLTYICADGITQRTLGFMPEAGSLTFLNFTVPDTGSIPSEHCTFILKPQEVKGNYYKVIKIVKDGEVYKIAAMAHNEEKYDFIEDTITIPDPTGDFANISFETIDPVTNIIFTPSYSIDPLGVVKKNIILTWDYSVNPIKVNGAIDYRIFGFNLGWSRDNGAITTVVSSQASYTLEDIPEGNYTVHLAVIDTTNDRSSALYTESYTFGGSSVPSSLLPPLDLYVESTTNTSFNNSDVTITWAYNPANNSVASLLHHYVVRIEDTLGNLLTPEISIALNAAKGGSLITGATAATRLNINPHRDTVVKVYSIDTLLNRSTAIQATFHKNMPPAPSFTVFNTGTSFSVSIISLTGYGVATYNVYAGDIAGFTKDVTSLVKSVTMDYTQTPPPYVVMDISYPSWLAVGGNIHFAVEALDSFS